jgi:DNA-binding response OmpR family regulator
MNVLIVEDETGLAEEIESFLKREHFVCDVAATGEDASEKLAVNLYVCFAGSRFTRLRRD